MDNLTMPIAFDIEENKRISVEITSDSKELHQISSFDNKQKRITAIYEG